MADLPIPFSAPMVRALLREIEAPGTGKTQTRRDHPPEPNFIPDGCCQADLGGRACWWDFWAHGRAERQRFKLPYAVGDRLYVREHWRTFVSLDDTAPRDLWSRGCGRGAGILYIADDGGLSLDAMGACYIGWRDNPEKFGRHRQGMHMPRWASRLTLIVTEVRVERLHDCSEADAWAEGCKKGDPDHAGGFFPAEEPDPSGIGHRGWDNARDWYADLWTEINGPGAWDANPWVAAYTFRPILGNIDQIEVQA